MWPTPSDRSRGNITDKARSGLLAGSYTSDHSGVIVNAGLFHALLEQVIKDYAGQLTNPEALDARRAFRRKMNFIARIEEQEPEQPHVTEVSDEAQ